MAKDNKETFSPTLIQSFLYQNKSPLSAFGEGLFDVGKTNEQIHDTIWNHDLRQEQREREQFRFEMEKEAHELKMRREKHAAEADERYGFTDRELAQQQVKAGIANTYENTRAIRTGTDRTIFNNTIQDIINASVGNGDFANGDITPKGQQVLDRYRQDAFNTDLPQKQRLDAFDMMTRIENGLGQYRLSYLKQPQEWDELDKEIYTEWLNIDPEQVKKNADGTISITGADREIKALSHARPFLRKYHNEYRQLYRGERELKDFSNEFQTQFINNANSIASRNGWTTNRMIQDNLNKMSMTNQFLEAICKDFNSALNATGIYDNQIRKFKDYTTGNKVSEKAIGALIQLRTAAMTKMYFGGNASNRDLAVIQSISPSVNQNDIQSLQLLSNFIRAEIRAIAPEVSKNPLEAYGKYGDEYTKLQSLSVLLDALIDNKIYYGDNHYGATMKNGVATPNSKIPSNISPVQLGQQAEGAK